MIGGHRAPGALRMRMIILGSDWRARLCAAVAAVASACLLSACESGVPSLTIAEQPLSKETMSMLGRKPDACAVFARFNQDYPRATDLQKRRIEQERQKNSCG